MKTSPFHAGSTAAANPFQSPTREVDKVWTFHISALTNRKREQTINLMATLLEWLNRGLRIFSILSVAISMTSCIYDAPGDRFFRTLWVSEEAPFGSGDTDTANWYELLHEVGSHGDDDNSTGIHSVTDGSKSGKLTLEFLCEGKVTVYANGAIGSFGSYYSYKSTAYFTGLQLNYFSSTPDTKPITIILEEAHRADDLLLISWHYSGSSVSYTTRLVRKGSYE